MQGEKKLQKKETCRTSSKALRREVYAKRWIPLLEWTSLLANSLTTILTGYPFDGVVTCGSVFVHAIVKQKPCEVMLVS